MTKTIVIVDDTDIKRKVVEALNNPDIHVKTADAMTKTKDGKEISVLRRGVVVHSNEKAAVYRSEKNQKVSKKGRAKLKRQFSKNAKSTLELCAKCSHTCTHMMRVFAWRTTNEVLSE